MITCLTGIKTGINLSQASQSAHTLLLRSTAMVKKAKQSLSKMNNRMGADSGSAVPELTQTIRDS